MYKKEKPISFFKGSTSALCNNLSVHINADRGIITYAVVHKSVVNFISTSIDGSTANHRQIVCKEPSAAQGSSMVFQAKLIPMPNRTILVITSQKGIQMFEADGSIMLYWYAVGDVNSQEIEACFARGICGVQSDTICVGNHEGHILVFDIPGRGTNITVAEILKGHKSAICDIASEHDKVVSSDELGDIILWQAGDTFQQISRIGGTPGVPCTSLKIWDDLIVAGYLTGHLRMFSASTGRISAEVTAHARCITAIDVAPKSGMILTVGEDSFVHIWAIKRRSPVNEIEHKYSESVTDLQLQGAQFLNQEGRSFCATGYDSNELHFFTEN